MAYILQCVVLEHSRATWPLCSKLARSLILVVDNTGHSFEQLWQPLTSADTIMDWRGLAFWWLHIWPVGQLWAKPHEWQWPIWLSQITSILQSFELAVTTVLLGTYPKLIQNAITNHVLHRANTEYNSENLWRSTSMSYSRNATGDLHDDWRWHLSIPLLYNSIYKYQLY